MDYCGCGYPPAITDPYYNFQYINMDYDAYAYSLTSKWRYLSSKNEIIYEWSTLSMKLKCFYSKVGGYAPEYV